MSIKRGSYQRRNTRKFTRDELRAYELTAAKSLGIKVAAQTKRFFAVRNIEDGGLKLSPDWDTANIEQPRRRFVAYNSADLPRLSSPPASLMPGTVSFALRVTEEIRIAQASGKLTYAADQQAGEFDGLHTEE